MTVVDLPFFRWYTQLLEVQPQTIYRSDNQGLRNYALRHSDGAIYILSVRVSPPPYLDERVYPLGAHHTYRLRSRSVWSPEPLPYKVKRQFELLRMEEQL